MAINWNAGYLYSNNVGFSTGSNKAQKEQEVSILESELQGYENEYSSVSGEKSSLDGQQSSAQSNVQTTQAAISAAQTNLSSAQAALSDAMSTPVETIQNEDGTTTQDSSARDEAIRIAQALLNAAKEELAGAQADNEQAQQEVEKINQQIQEVQQQLDTINQNKSDTQSELNTAQSELQTAETQEAEQKKEQEKIKQEQEKEDNNEENSDDDNFSLYKKNLDMTQIFESSLENSDLIPDAFNLEKAGKKKEEITDEEYSDIADSAKIILNSDSYSEEEIEKVQDDLDAILDQNFNLRKEDVKKYADLATDLKDYSENKTEELEDEIEQEILEIFQDVNLKNGVSEETVKAVASAFEEIGVTEIPGRPNKGEMEKYQKYPDTSESGEPWCASFVSWTYGEAQGSDNENTFGYNNAVRFIREEAEEAGYYSLVSEYEPVAGDIMIQESNGASHTGMVVKTDENYIYTIEGNAGDAVRAKKYNKNGESIGKISGYVRMNEWNGSSTNPFNIDYLPDQKYEDADKDLKQSTL